MAKQDGFPVVFAGLKRNLEPYAASLTVMGDDERRYSLDAPPSASYPSGLFFGSVIINRNYVSFHLMPVYVFPDLLEDVSDPLRKRMQGKSCFNFTKLDEGLTIELAELTGRGFARYQGEGLV